MTPLLTAEDLAPLLGLGADQVRKLAREGTIPQHRIGGAIRFDYEAVKAATRQGGAVDQVEIGRRHLARIVETHAMRLPYESNSNRAIHCVMQCAFLLKELGIYDQKMVSDAVTAASNRIGQAIKASAHE